MRMFRTLKTVLDLGAGILLAVLGAGLALKLVVLRLVGDREADARTRGWADRLSARNSNSTGSVTGRAATLGTPSSPALSKMRLSRRRARKGCLLISSISATTFSSAVGGLGFLAAYWPLFWVRNLGLWPTVRR